MSDSPTGDAIDPNITEPRLAMSESRQVAVIQRTAYGLLVILVLVTIFLCDVAISQACEPSDTFLEGAGAAGVVGSMVNTIIDGRIGDLLSRGSVLPLFVLAMMLAGAVEFIRLARVNGANPCAPVVYVMVTALVASPWLSAAGWLGTRPAHVEGLYWTVIAMVAAGVAMAVVTVRRGRPEGAFLDIGATLTIIFFLGFLGSFPLQLRCDRDIPGQEGAWLLLIVVLVTKASDIGAYFVGTAMGRHKLAPGISPGKSVEGLVGGLAASAGVAVAIAATGMSRSFCVTVDGTAFSGLWQPFLFGLALSITGQVGDLLESCFKRDAGSKDSGKVIPRFGGILDLVDSPVLAIPVGWFLLTEVWSVV